MFIYKFSSIIYSNSLSASGRQNRWNYQDQFVIYGAQYTSLALLEMCVRRSAVDPLLSNKIMTIALPDNQKYYNEIKLSQLNKSWRDVGGYPHTQAMANDWYQNKLSLVLKVPSAIIPSEHNYVINTQHPDFHLVQLHSVIDYEWDLRLL